MNTALHAFLTSVLPAGRGPASRSGCFITKARVPGVHWLSRLLEPRVNLAGRGGGGVAEERGKLLWSWTSSIHTVGTCFTDNAFTNEIIFLLSNITYSQVPTRLRTLNPQWFWNSTFERIFRLQQFSPFPLTRLVANLSFQRPRADPRPDHVESVVDNH